MYAQRNLVGLGVFLPTVGQIWLAEEIGAGPVDLSELTPGFVGKDNRPLPVNYRDAGR
nr:hypothetical protein [Prosthecochloris sp. HL-130-GSB]